MRIWIAAAVAATSLAGCGPKQKPEPADPGAHAAAARVFRSTAANALGRLTLLEEQTEAEGGETQLTLMFENGFETVARLIGPLPAQAVAIDPATQAPVTITEWLHVGADGAPPRLFQVIEEGGPPTSKALCDRPAAAVIVYEHAGGVKLAGVAGALPNEADAALCGIESYVP